MKKDLRKVVNEIKQHYPPLERGEVLWKVFAGFRYLGYKRLRWNGKEFRFEGHDGTGNSYFFRPFNRAVDFEKAVDITYDLTTLDEAINVVLRYLITRFLKKKIDNYELHLLNKFIAEDGSIDYDRVTDFVYSCTT